MRGCPFPGCRGRVAEHMAVCRRHWWVLTRTERAKLQAAFNDYLADRIGVEDLRRRQQAVLTDRGDACKGCQ